MSVLLPAGGDTIDATVSPLRGQETQQYRRQGQPICAVAEGFLRSYAALVPESKTFHAHGLAVYGGGPTSRGTGGAEGTKGSEDFGERVRAVCDQFLAMIKSGQHAETLRAALDRLEQILGADADADAAKRVEQLVAAFDRFAARDESLEQFNAMYQRRQAIARLEESGAEPYSESSLHAAFEWLLSCPLYPVAVRHERASLDVGQLSAMRQALSTTHPDLIAEFFTRARQAGFAPEDPAALTKALQIAMLRYVERDTSDQLV